MSEETFDIMQFAEESASEGGGARPMTCQVRIDGGYVSYARGLSPEDRFFSAAKYGRDEAKEKAKKIGEPEEAGFSPVVRMTVFRDSVLGRKVDHWKYDTLAYDYITWQSAYTEVFLPALNEAIENGFIMPVENWVRLEYVADPYRAKKNDGTTNWRAFIAEVFNTEQEAADSVGVEVEKTSGRSVPTEPDAWSSIDDGEGSWERFFNSLIDNFKENPNVSLTELVYLDGGVTLDIVQRAKQIADDESIPF